MVLFEIGKSSGSTMYLSFAIGAYGISIGIKNRFAADLPTQPPVRLSYPKTSLSASVCKMVFKLLEVQLLGILSILGILSQAIFFLVVT